PRPWPPNRTSAPPPPPDPFPAPGRTALPRPPPPPPPANPRSMEKASSLYLKGELDSKEEKFDEAILAFQEAVRIDPNSYDAYVKLGYALYRRQRYQESAEASEKAIKLRKGFEPYYNSGLAYMELGRWDEAKTAFYG